MTEFVELIDGIIADMRTAFSLDVGVQISTNRSRLPQSVLPFGSVTIDSIDIAHETPKFDRWMPYISIELNFAPEGDESYLIQQIAKGKAMYDLIVASPTYHGWAVPQVLAILTPPVEGSEQILQLVIELTCMQSIAKNAQ